MAAENSINNESHDLSALFSSESRDFLIRNNGDKVEIKALSGKTVGLYFSASWCPPCRRFTPALIETYNELSSKGDFEVVFVSADRDEESFNAYFSKMPWLSIPFSDASVKRSLNAKFQVTGIPHLVILNAEGKVVTDDAVGLVIEHQANAYPFTPERIEQLKEEEEEAKRNQTLTSLLVSGSRDYLVSGDGSKVPVSELVGKHVLIYFSAHWCPPCRGFTPKLVKTYNEMKTKGYSVEVVFASSDRDQSSFDEYYSEMPWLAIPFGDDRKAFLSRRFEVRGIPSLVAIGPEGKTITTETRKLIEDHGADAFPFTESHIEDLKRKPEIKEGYICEGDVCRKI